MGRRASHTWSGVVLARASRTQTVECRVTRPGLLRISLGSHAEDLCTCRGGELGAEGGLNVLCFEQPVGLDASMVASAAIRPCFVAGWLYKGRHQCAYEPATSC
mmetsp:Transcript_11317/g.24719  ORF Transcript_11317/g.24719 Transcript_11317/m.24719 type:complete len:104 (+) Transcript_11317:1308-1619(+)